LIRQLKSCVLGWKVTHESQLAISGGNTRSKGKIAENQQVISNVTLIQSSNDALQILQSK
jgi:hypothetical protein